MKKNLKKNVKSFKEIKDSLKPKAEKRNVKKFDIPTPLKSNSPEEVQKEIGERLSKIIIKEKIVEIFDIMMKSPFPSYSLQGMAFAEELSEALKINFYEEEVSLEMMSLDIVKKAIKNVWNKMERDPEKKDAADDFAEMVCKSLGIDWFAKESNEFNSPFLDRKSNG